MIFRILLLAMASMAGAGTVSDGGIGYAITLPPNWVQIKTSADHHYFRDTTRQYKSQISILKYAIDPASYSSPRAWTQAQIIAYQLAVENSVYPFGAIVYFDTSASAVIGPLWAPEAMSIMYPADGDPTYSEYMHYTAQPGYGYEIYAIGDSTDMVNNVDTYSSIISTIQLSEPTTIAAEPPADKAHPSLRSEVEFDANGRRVSIRADEPPSLAPSREQRLFRSPSGR